MLEVTYTDDALADLRDIGDWIAQDSRSSAARFIDELFAYGDSIGETPYLYPPMPRYERHGIRKRNFRGYLIFYRVAERVEVVRVISERRDYIKLLFED